MVAAGRGLAPTGLPVEDVVPELRACLSGRGVAVLQAEPGAGKTTVVPLRLLGEPWLSDGRIVVLEPRRLAARAAAARMAELLGEDVGATVGYATRDDRRIGRTTRVEVVTDGILTRRLQREPTLPGTALVVFDEFHERHLQADLGLTLTLDVRDGLRPGPAGVGDVGDPRRRADRRAFGRGAGGDQLGADLSGGGALAARPTPGPAGAGRRRRGRGRRWSVVRATCLVFLPGVGEIRAVAAALGPLPGWRFCRCMEACPPPSRTGSCDLARVGGWCCPPMWPRPA